MQPALQPAYGTLCSMFYDATKQYAPQKEVDFYVAHMPQGGRILEAMSGSGRLQIPFTQRGFVVDGIDNSQSMLKRFYQRCADLGISLNTYQQSLEDMQLPARYDAAIIAVGSFQLISNRAVALRALRALRAHMHEGGVLMIEIFKPDLAELVPPVRIAQIDQYTVVRLHTRHVPCEAERVVESICTYELLVRGQIERTEYELMTITWYEDHEIEELLAQAAFVVEAITTEDLRPTGLSRIVRARAV